MNAPSQTPALTPEQLAQIARSEGMVVPGRACGSCTLCCKIPSIPDLDKPRGKWCSHCQPGKGCGIYATRPLVCRTSMCEWLICKGLGPEWKPEKSKFVMYRTNEGRRLTAHVDQGYPAAWRATPYYENFKNWAKEAAQKSPMHQIDIMIGDRLIVVLPDRDVEIGVVAEGEVISMTKNAAGAVSVEKVLRAL